jgi:hypothetical protein
MKIISEKVVRTKYLFFKIIIITSIVGVIQQCVYH